MRYYIAYGLVASLVTAAALLFRKWRKAATGKKIKFRGEYRS